MPVILTLKLSALATVDQSRFTVNITASYTAKMETTTMAATEADREDAASVLFKGLGFLFSRAHAASEPEYQDAVQILTGINASINSQFDLLYAAIASLPHGTVRTVTENAFGGYSPYQGQSLADRRRSIAEQFDISARTVFRHESRGVRDIVKHIDRLLEREDFKVAEEELTPTDKSAVTIVTEKATALMAQIEEIDSAGKGPETVARMRDAVKSFLDDVELYDFDDTAPEFIRALITKYRDWHEDLDEMYWRLRMKND